MQPRVLLLSAYTATSHRLWCERLQQLFPQYHWTTLTLPPRHFNWRIRGNSLLWAFSQRELLQQPYDLLIATSMVDLSSLRGLLPALARIPTLLYFHENQFAYPEGARRNSNVEPQLVPLYAALCADRIVFNSAYNLSTFLQGARSLFKRLPDDIPPAVLQRLEAATVIPVPLPDLRAAPDTCQPLAGAQPGILEVIWNHRWEYDKGTELLLATCQQLLAQKLPVRLHVAGEQFRQQPAEFQQLDALLAVHAAQIGVPRGQFGFMPLRTHYDSLLSRCDVVLSTARHDFQGLAVQEACIAGCTPLAPADLVYPEYLDSRFLYPRESSTSDTAAAICARLAHWQSDKAAGRPRPQAALQAYTATALRPQYAAVFAALLAGGQGQAGTEGTRRG